uniref:Uncharacterized protein n=1 Tax=Agrobacterium tumefaciens TaxID=358 RepID=A0A3Q8BJ79_AGRTU|nr:hypothetical protein AgrTiEU6_60 [Agrobacterium tumefaciens]
MTVCRLVANFRAIAETLMPFARSSRTSFFCSSLSVAGRPRVLPSDLARLRPDCVRSTSRSFELGDGVKHLHGHCAG